MTQKLRVSILGAGVFGTYHAQKALQSDLAELAGVFDADFDRSRQLTDDTAAPAFGSADAAFSACGAVIIATPAKTHFELALAALGAGKHVLVEKPLALTRADASQLVDRAEKAGLVLQVGHQERLVCGALGLFDQQFPIERLELLRCGPAPKGGRAMDVSVIWDLMIHDLDLTHCLLGEEAVVDDLSAVCELGEEFDEVEAKVRIGGVPVSLKASRLAEKVERRVRLYLSTGLIEVDFVNRRLKNSSPFELNSDFASDVPDPLGAADEAFFAACLGLAPTPISGRSSAFAVATAEKLTTLAQASKGKL